MQTLRAANKHSQPCRAANTHSQRAATARARRTVMLPEPSTPLKPCTSSTTPLESSSMPLPGISPGLVHRLAARSGCVTSRPVSMMQTVMLCASRCRAHAPGDAALPFPPAHAGPLFVKHNALRWPAHRRSARTAATRRSSAKGPACARARGPTLSGLQPNPEPLRGGRRTRRPEHLHVRPRREPDRALVPLRGPGRVVDGRRGQAAHAGAQRARVPALRRHQAVQVRVLHARVRAQRGRQLPRAQPRAVAHLRAGGAPMSMARRERAAPPPVLSRGKMPCRC